MTTGRTWESIMFNAPKKGDDVVKPHGRFGYDKELSERFETYLNEIPRLLDEKPYYSVDQLVMKLNGVNDVCDVPEGATQAVILVLDALRPKYGSIGTIPSGDKDPLHCADKHIYGRIF